MKDWKPLALLFLGLSVMGNYIWRIFIADEPIHLMFTKITGSSVEC